MMPSVAGSVHAWEEYNRAPWGRLRLDLIHDALGQHAFPRRVLDVGCGTGETAVWFAQAGSQVLAIDPSEAMLARAAANAERVGAHVQWHLGDAAGAAAVGADGRFDAVLCHNVLGYVADPAGTCASLRRLVTDGGYLSVTVTNRLAEPLRAAIMRHDLDAAKDSLENGGFRRFGEACGKELALNDFAEVDDWFANAGIRVAVRRGIRVVNDYLVGADDLKLSPDGYASLFALERELSEREPYRRIAAMLHVIGYAGTPPDRGRVPNAALIGTSANDSIAS